MPGWSGRCNPTVPAKFSCRLRRKDDSVMSKFLLAVLAMVAVVPGAFAGTTPLDSYLDDMKTLRATFLQTLADAHGREIDRSTGTLVVSRPGKFSWEIHAQGAGGAGAAAAVAGAAMGGAAGAG